MDEFKKKILFVVNYDNLENKKIKNLLKYTFNR